MVARAESAPSVRRTAPYEQAAAQCVFFVERPPAFCQIRRMAKETLTITDNRTGKTYEVPIENGCIRAMDAPQIKVDEQDFGLMAYDPAFLNTANCKSAITFIDGDKGILEYRGYPIDQLAEKLDLPRGRVPDHERRAADARSSSKTSRTWSRTTPTSTRTSRTSWTGSATTRTRCRCSARPSPRSPRSTPRRRTSRTSRTAAIQMIRLIAKMPTIAAFSLPPHDGPAVRLPGQRALVRRQLPRDGEEDRHRDLRAAPGAREGARRPLHPPRRPRAELQHHRGAHRRLVGSRPLLGGRRGRERALTARSTAARTRPCSACSARSATSRRSPTSSSR